MGFGSTCRINAEGPLQVRPSSLAPYLCQTAGQYQTILSSLFFPAQGDEQEGRRPGGQEARRPRAVFSQ